MIGKREMAGTVDYSFSKLGSLEIGEMIRRSPEPAYTSKCQCGAHGQSISQSQLRNGTARCLSSSHGKVAKPSSRELLQEQKRIAAAAEDERIAAERSASEMRMSAETEDYALPAKLPPVPANTAPESERQRLARRAWGAEQESERIAADAPRLEAERLAAARLAEVDEQFKSTASQAARMERDAVANGRDSEFAIDPATVGESAAIPASELDAWHAAQFAEFLKANPDYYRCDANAAAINSFLERNAPGLRLLSAAQLTACYKRLSSYGLLQQRPAPAPVPQSPQPRRVNLSVAEPPKRIGPKVHIGRDYTTGLEREFTQVQVDRMSSLEFKRAFPVASTFAELLNSTQK